MLYKNCLKRLLDIMLSLLALPFVAIVGIPIAIAVKREDGGPVFYRSLRYGKDMKKFSMLKFRSMKVNAKDIRNQDGTTYNSENDERQTRIGRLLRKTSLDELPQFVNVLKGDMSFIGPRPSPMGNEATYTDFVKKKFRVRPGITGYNQALKRNSATLEERYRNDVFYAENVSFPLDVKIILMTIVSVVKRKNIYRS
jgi:lipopolysaccharide/colanic/teichoic acid biosynthesis glycosyltransferase